jgi:UDP-N-acetylmuramoyl-tripeptide--D-alanyl-D-alanine ligase
MWFILPFGSMALREIHHSPRTRLGRLHLLLKTFVALKPALYPIASLYRRTCLRHGKIIAVVGSYGKTTTTRAVKTALGLRCDPWPHRSAGVFIAYELLRIRPGQRQSAIEVGIDGPGQMEPMARLIRPDIAIVTSIGQEHWTSLKNLETTRFEKSKMVEALSGDGLAILNGDDPNVQWMGDRTDASAVTFGMGRKNFVRASEIELDWPNGMRFRLHFDGRTHEVRSRLLGRHMVYPLLAAVAVARHVGLDPAEYLPRLKSLAPTSGRLELFRLSMGAYAIRDDCKSSFETVEKAFEVLVEVPARRRIIVLGEITEPPKPAHQTYKRIGQAAARIADRLIVVGSRNLENAYASGARSAGGDRIEVLHAHHSVRAAIEFLETYLRPGDVVLVKGSRRQRLERVTYALLKRDVQCTINPCYAKVNCEHCPNLTRGRQA